MKDFSPTLREQYRLSVLRYLATILGRSLTEGVILQFLRAEWGTPLDAETVAQLMAYLQGKGLVEETPKRISPEIRSWKITAAGADEHAKLTGE